jgi:hypothetical protein
MHDVKAKKAGPEGDGAGAQIDTRRPEFDPAKLARDYEADPPSRRPTPHAGTEYEALRDSCRPMQAARVVHDVLPQVHPDSIVEVVISEAQVDALGLRGPTGALVAAMNGLRTVRSVAAVTQIDLPTALLRTAFLVERGFVRVVR